MLKKVSQLLSFQGAILIVLFSTSQLANGMEVEEMVVSGQMSEKEQKVFKEYSDIQKGKEEDQKTFLSYTIELPVLKKGSMYEDIDYQVKGDNKEFLMPMGYFSFLVPELLAQIFDQPGVIDWLIFMPYINKTFHAFILALKEDYVQVFMANPEKKHLLTLKDKTGAYSLISFSPSRDHVVKFYRSFMGDYSYIPSIGYYSNRFEFQSGKNTFCFNDSTKIIIDYDSKEQVVRVAETDLRPETEVRFLIKTSGEVRSFFEERGYIIPQKYCHTYYGPDSQYFTEGQVHLLIKNEIREKLETKNIDGFNVCYNRHGIIVHSGENRGNLVYTDPCEKKTSVMEFQSTTTSKVSFFKDSKNFPPKFTLFRFSPPEGTMVFLNMEPATIIDAETIKALWGNHH